MSNYALKTSHNPYFNRWFSAISNQQELQVLADKVTILILIDGFLQFEEYEGGYDGIDGVTILILIDGFLQYI